MMIFKEIVYQILFFYTFELIKRKEPMKLRPTITIHYRIGYPKGSR